MSSPSSRLTYISIDPAPTPELERERRVAIYDLLEDNSFALSPLLTEAELPSQYRLSLAIRERRLVFGVSGAAGQELATFYLSLGPFRQVIKDYFQICESYHDAVKHLPPGQIEAIDMARRSIHNEGAKVLQERLHAKAEVDIDTARRLFTLICTIYRGGL